MRHQMTYRSAWTVAGLAIGLLWPGDSLRADTANQLFVERAYHDLLAQVPDEGNLTILAGDLDAEELTLMQVAGRIDGGDPFHAVEVQPRSSIIRIGAATPTPVF